MRGAVGGQEAVFGAGLVWGDISVCGAIVDGANGSCAASSFSVCVAPPGGVSVSRAPATGRAG